MLLERKFEVRDFSLSAIAIAPQNHTQTLLMLHGWMDNAASFQALLPLLHQSFPNAQILALDLPGHGMSSHANSGFYAFHDYLDVLNQVIGQLNNERGGPVVLIGHSMGALIASCYSAVFPHQVSHLIQIEGYGPIHEPESNSIERVRKALLSRQRITTKSTRTFDNIQTMMTIRAATTGLSCQEISAIVERDSQQVASGWKWRHDPKLKADSVYRMSQAHALEVLQRLPNRNLLILGQTGFEQLAHERQSVMHPATQTVIVEGGHHCHISDPQSVCCAIADFILSD